MIHPSETMRLAVERGFEGASALVVGDLMLDGYLRGDVRRVSPEAPVPVLRLTRRTESPGGAGNVALNLAALGLRVAVVGLVGRDEAGGRLRRLLGEGGAECLAVEAGDGRQTTVKTRVLGGHQQMLRIDDESPHPANVEDQARLIAEAAARLAEGPAALILSDYDKGALTPHVCRSLIAEARRLRVPVLVDPKGLDFRKYAGAGVLTPNRLEFEIATGTGRLDEAAFREAARLLRADLGLDLLVVTRGEEGVSAFDDSGDLDVPAAVRQVFDVSGAGDTLLATLAAGLAAGLGREDALRLANLAAGVVVGQVGTAPISREDLLAALSPGPLASQSRKVCDLPSLLRRAAGWRSAGERIVFTNGCFDLLHAGHVSILTRARAEGDRLVVGLNTDRSVRALKGEGRPVIAEDDRAQILAGLASVDAVVLFDDPTPFRLIEALGPDVLAKGADYDETHLVGADLVRARGGAVVLIPLLDGRSTTGLLERFT